MLTRNDGQVPDGWQVVRLEDVAEVAGGSTPSRTNTEFWGDGIPWVVPSELTKLQGRYLKATKESITYAGLKSTGLKIIPAGSILLTSRATIGVTAINTIPLVTNQGFQNLVVKSGVAPLWLYYGVSAMSRELERRAAGSTFLEVSRDSVRSLPILLPPLPEQRAIAAVLDAIDAAIERTEAVIAATERLRDALLHELLTRGVPGWHTAWKDVPGIGTMPADWEVVRLGDVAEVERGKFAHRPRNEPRFYGGNIPFIQTGDVVRANVKIRQHSQTLNESGLSISRLFPAGTIVITIAANIGETAIAAYPVAFPDSLVGIVPSGIDTEFLELFLRTQKTRLNQLAPESAQKNINLEDLRPLPTVLPCDAEQIAVAAVLDGIQDAINLVREERDRIQLLKASAADALLTGWVRVPLRG